MKKIKPKIKTRIKLKAKHPLTDLLQISTLATQILEDIEHIYKIHHGTSMAMTSDNKEALGVRESHRSINKVKNNSWVKNLAARIAATPLMRFLQIHRKTKAQVVAELPIQKNGELIVIASRSKKLSDELKLRLTRQITLTQKQPIIIFSTGDSFIHILRMLVNALADIPEGAAIYDGQLSEAEVKRLSFSLNELNAAQIYIYPTQMIRLDHLCETVRMFQMKTGEIGLVLVDAVQHLKDNQWQNVGVQESLIRLKALAEEINVPVLALYQLDPAIEDHPSTLTRYELGEIAALNELTDGIMLMSGTREKFVFATPKYPRQRRTNG